MSTIKTLSSFFYGTLVTSENYAIDFDEGGPELNASLTKGSYTLTEYAAEVQRALREAGNLLYSVSFNRLTRKLTVSAPSTFNLRTNTGSRAISSAFTMIGFSLISDHTGLSSYLAENQVGKEYITQMPVDKYVAPEHSIVKEGATVNTSVTGVTQIVHFGEGSRPKMNIRGITNKLGMTMPVWYENANGVANALDFYNFLINKNKIEFMPDKDQKNTFYKLFLESSDADKSGIELELQNMAPDWYQTGLLVFRKVIS